MSMLLYTNDKYIKNRELLATFIIFQYELFTTIEDVFSGEVIPNKTHQSLKEER